MSSLKQNVSYGFWASLIPLISGAYLAIILTLTIITGSYLKLWQSQLFTLLTLFLIIVICSLLASALFFFFFAWVLPVPKEKSKIYIKSLLWIGK